MAEKRPPIAILGAGPAGLMLGRVLELAGIEYTVYEREKTPFARGYQGGTLDIHVEDGQQALKEAGLFDEFQKLARYDATNVIADKNGKVFAKHDDGEEANGRPEIDRKHLRELLLASVPKERVQWDRKVKQVLRAGDGSMQVVFENGGTETGFKLVVGADGAWSKARGLITSAKPVYSGMSYFTTEIRPSNVFYTTVESLAGPGNYMSFGRQRSIAAQRMGDGSYSLLFGLPLPEESDVKTGLMHTPQELREWLLREIYSDWSTVNTDIVRRSDAAFGVWPLYRLAEDALSWKTVPGVTLIGDAAHLTIPSGEGANAALYDGFKLAEQIKKHGVHDLDRAVVEYEKELQPRAIKLHNTAESLAKLLNSFDSPGQDWKQFMEEQGAAEGDVVQIS